MSGQSADEGDLVLDASRGDHAAFEVLVRRYQALAFRTAYLITGDASDAEDAAQTGFFKAFRALDRFRFGEPFRPWLLTIVANEARNYRGASMRRARFSLAVDLSALPIKPDPLNSPEAHAIANERRTSLIAAITSMREEDRTILTLRYALDFTEVDMASALGIARGTVKSRLSRALGRLRKALDGEADV
ncbi:MAG: sigma-70 family RNA polymerase sigma factor [Chloroflexota bacterium]|nr:sigma-70 family RNA polymerase sigma factor [Chloroflexota bacterium]